MESYDSVFVVISRSFYEDSYDEIEAVFEDEETANKYMKENNLPTSKEDDENWYEIEEHKYYRA